MARKKQSTPTNLIIPLLLIAGIGLLIYTGGFGFNLLETPDCTFPDGGGSCNYEMTIPADQEASRYVMDLSFLSVPATSYTDLSTVSYIDKRRAYEEDRSRDEKDTYELYLYRLPAGPEAEAIKISATMSAELACTSDEYGDAGVSIYVINIPYPPSIIEYATRDDSRYHDVYDLYEQHSETRDGDETHSWKKATGIGYVEIADCRPGERNTGVKTLTVEWKNPPAHNDTSELAFIVVGDEEERGGAYVVTREPTDVQVSFARAVYPTDVTYRIGSQNVGSFPGVQDGTARTLDMGALLNAACPRDKTSESCTVPITFESTTAGAFNAQVDASFKPIFTKAPILDPEPPAEDPRAGGDTDEPTDEAPPGPGVGAWFANIWNNIASFFKGVFSI